MPLNLMKIFEATKLFIVCLTVCDDVIIHSSTIMGMASQILQAHQTSTLANNT